MASNKLTSSDINRVIEEINALIRRYTIPGILAILIGFGVLLLALTYLPYVIGLLAVALVGYLAWLRLR